MKHCNQCGSKVNLDSKYCQDCGAELFDTINKSIDANLKIDLTNKTTEKVLAGVGSGISSGVTGAKKLTSRVSQILWRVIKFVIVVGIIAGVASILFHLYENNQKEMLRNERAKAAQEKINQSAQERRTKIENAKRYSKKWVVYGAIDPASKKKIARTASITSEDGLCELTVQKRISGNELTGINCMDVKISEYDDIYIIFDTNEVSSKMNITSYTDSDEVYIPSGDQASYSGYMSYTKFINGLFNSNAVAIKIPNDESFWVRFTLKGSTEAINHLGKEMH